MLMPFSLKENGLLVSRPTPRIRKLLKGRGQIASLNYTGRTPAENPPRTPGYPRRNSHLRVTQPSGAPPSARETGAPANLFAGVGKRDRMGYRAW